MCDFHGRFLASPPRSQGIGQVQGLNVGQMVEIVKNTAGFIWSHMENIWKYGGIMIKEREIIHDFLFVKHKNHENWERELDLEVG